MVLVGHSTGGGEVTRYLGRHGTDRVAKAMLVGAIPPLMLKTDANPGGLPIEAFDAIRAGVSTAGLGTGRSSPAPATNTVWVKGSRRPSPLARSVPKRRSCACTLTFRTASERASSRAVRIATPAAWAPPLSAALPPKGIEHDCDMASRLGGDAGGPRLFDVREGPAR